MLVSDIMNERPVTVAPDETCAFAARQMARYNVGSLPVCSKGGELRGIVTDRDIVLRCVAMSENPERRCVKDIMTRPMVTVAQTDDVLRASYLMAGAQVRRLPVTLDGKLVGMVALADLAKRKECDAEAATALCEISANIKKK